MLKSLHLVSDSNEYLGFINFSNCFDAIFTPSISRCLNIRSVPSGEGFYLSIHPEYKKEKQNTLVIHDRIL